MNDITLAVDYDDAPELIVAFQARMQAHQRTIDIYTLEGDAPHIVRDYTERVAMLRSLIEQIKDKTA